MSDDAAAAGVELDELEVLVVVDNESDTLSSIDPGVPQLAEAAHLAARTAVSRQQDGHDAKVVFDRLCCACHGLSLLITGRRGHVEHRILFDVGPYPDVWLANARRLGVDPSTIEYVFLSHWHFDHSGGLPDVVGAIAAARTARGLSRPTVDLHPNRPDQRGLLTAAGVILLLPTEPTPDAIAHAGGDVVSHAGPHVCCDGFFHGSGSIERVTGYETGLPGHCSFRGAVCEPDPLILDERFLAAVVAGRGLTILSACSHAGIINVCQQARRSFPRAAIDAVLHVFVSQAAASVSGLHRVTIGLPVALAIVAMTVLVAAACGVVPALHAVRTGVSPLVRSGSSRGPQAWRLRGALVVAQIALSCVLLIGAGLLTRTVSAVMHEDHGFRPDGALEAKVVLSDTMLFDRPEREAFVRTLLERVRALPGVLYAGFGSNLPPQPPVLTMAIRLVRQNLDETRMMKGGSASPGYLRALGVRFIAGRDFDDGDAQRGDPVVILSESVARFYFPGQDAVGRTIARMPAMFRMPGEPRVIGVVSDVKYEGLDSPASAAIYIPWASRPLGRGYLLVRADGDPMRLATAIRAAAREIDASVPIPEIQSLEAVMAESISARSVRALPAAGFGLLALAVALVGVLATMTTLVAERRRDLAIRAALGASPSRLVRTLMLPGLALTAAGVVMGLSLGGAAARSLASLVYGISPYDAATFAGTAAAIVSGAAVMTYAAALRARSVDPLAILKQD